MCTLLLSLSAFPLTSALCFSVFSSLKSSVMQLTKGKQCRFVVWVVLGGWFWFCFVFFFFFPLGIHSSFSCNTVDVQKWSENPSKNFIAGKSPRECQQWWESLRRLRVQVCFGMVGRSLQNSTKHFQTSEPWKEVGKGSKNGRAVGTLTGKARKYRRPKECKITKRGEGGKKENPHLPQPKQTS